MGAFSSGVHLGLRTVEAGGGCSPAQSPAPSGPRQTCGAWVFRGLCRAAGRRTPLPSRRPLRGARALAPAPASARARRGLGRAGEGARGGGREGGRTGGGARPLRREGGALYGQCSERAPPGTLSKTSLKLLLELDPRGGSA